MEGTKTRIIWISDVHLRNSYFKSVQAQDKLANYFDNFRKTISSERKIDYILLSGDIAFSGTEEDYTVFWKYFIEPLGKLFSNEKTRPKIIVIPGNHDISWEHVDHFLDKFLNAYDVNTIEMDKRISLIDDDNVDEFSMPFKNYSAFFAKIPKFLNKAEIKIWKSFFSFANEIGSNRFCISEKYDNHKLFGYLVDYKLKIIFVFLNSAWLSIGDKFNEVLADSNPVEEIWKHAVPAGKIFNLKLFKSAITKVLDLKSRIVEFGNQTIAGDSFPLHELDQLIRQNPSFPVLSIMHHPLSWLNWGEVYNYDGVENEHLKLNSILNFSDVLLTGHEHVPIGKQYETLNNRVLHFKAGMFLEDNIWKKKNVLKPKFDHSRFSILEIDDFNKRKLISERKFLYVESEGKKEWIERKDLSVLDIPLKFKKEYLTDERKKSLTDSIAKFKITVFLSDKLGVPVSNISVLNKDEKGDSVYYCFDYLNTIRLCFLPKKSTFFDKGDLEDGKDFSQLCSTIDKIIDKNSSKKIVVSFIWLDLILEEESEKKYPFYKTEISKKEYESPEKVYNQIANECELKFNIYRHSFFMAKEEVFLNEKDAGIPYSLKNSFIPLSNISFINDVISYWVWERYL